MFRGFNRLRGFRSTTTKSPKGTFFTLRTPIIKTISRRCTTTQTNAALNTTRSVIQTNNRSVKYWLAGGAALVYGIILVGGITRLTESGLSMVDWNLQGRMYPKSEEEWEIEFAKYKQFPEFKRLCPDMTLDEFKKIFFWEYSHRMIGRFIGLYITVPFLAYVATGAIRGRLLVRSSMFVGGVGFQGLLGWWMVKSGLTEPQRTTDQPRVSQYRLSAHLGTALALYCGMFWTALELFRPNPETLQKSSLTKNLKFYKRSIHGLLGLGLLFFFFFF